MASHQRSGAGRARRQVPAAEGELARERISQRYYDDVTGTEDHADSNVLGGAPPTLQYTQSISMQQHDQFGGQQIYNPATGTALTHHPYGHPVGVMLNENYVIGGDNRIPIGNNTMSGTSISRREALPMERDWHGTAPRQEAGPPAIGLHGTISTGLLDEDDSEEDEEDSRPYISPSHAVQYPASGPQQQLQHDSNLRIVGRSDLSTATPYSGSSASYSYQSPGRHSAGSLTSSSSYYVRNVFAPAGRSDLSVTTPQSESTESQPHQASGQRNPSSLTPSDSSPSARNVVPNPIEDGGVGLGVAVDEGGAMSVRAFESRTSQLPSQALMPNARETSTTEAEPSAATPRVPLEREVSHSSGGSDTSCVDSVVRRAQESMQSFSKKDQATDHIFRQELPPPPCPMKPQEPTLMLKTSRRCLERIRQQQHQPQQHAPPGMQATLVLGLQRIHYERRRTHAHSSEAEECDLLTSSPQDFMTVDCEYCREELMVPKSAVVVECPNCHKFSAASSQQSSRRTSLTAAATGNTGYQ